MMYLDYLMKIGLSLILGGLIGFERDQQNKPMGLRDVIFVSLGATLLTILSFELPKIIPTTVNYDIGRIMAYLVGGCGWLGAGVIINNKNKFEGITTASLLFSILAIGFFCGLGLYALAIISTVAIYITLKLKHVKIELEKGVKKCRKKRRK